MLRYTIFCASVVVVVLVETEKDDFPHPFHFSLQAPEPNPLCFMVALVFLSSFRVILFEWCVPCPTILSVFYTSHVRELNDGAGLGLDGNARS